MLLGTVSLWALNFTVSKYILDHGLRPLSYSAVRYACATLVFLAITLVWEGSLRIGREQLPLAAACVALLFANQLSFVYSLKFTTATTVALIFGTLFVSISYLATSLGIQPDKSESQTVLSLIARTVRAGHAARIPVDVCGEAASDESSLPIIVGFGTDELSVAAARVGQVRQWVRDLDFADCWGRSEALLGQSGHTSRQRV